MLRSWQDALCKRYSVYNEYFIDQTADKWIANLDPQFVESVIKYIEKEEIVNTKEFLANNPLYSFIGRDSDEEEEEEEEEEDDHDDDNDHEDGLGKWPLCALCLAHDKKNQNWIEKSKYLRLHFVKYLFA